MPEQKPSYFAVIPATVRYDKSLPPAAKLLYGEITALTSVKGFCWCSNAYFAELYDVHKNTISVWIALLEKAGHIVVLPQSSTHARRITLRENIEGLREIIDTPQQNQVGPSTKTLIPLNENVDRINTVSNTENNTPTTGDELEKIDKEKVDAVSSLICSNYGITEKKQPTVFFSIVKMAKTIAVNGDIDELLRQATGYFTYKALADEKRHSLDGFIGSSDKKYLDGGWNKQNWEHNLEQYREKLALKTKQSNGKASTDPQTVYVAPKAGERKR